MLLFLHASAADENNHKLVQEMIFQMGQHPNWFDATRQEY